MRLAPRMGAGGRLCWGSSVAAPQRSVRYERAWGTATVILGTRHLSAKVTPCREGSRYGMPARRAGPQCWPAQLPRLAVVGATFTAARGGSGIVSEFGR